MDKKEINKAKKKEANKKYYDKIKEKLQTLDNIKNDAETKEQDNFFFQKHQKESAPEVKPPPQIIVQTPPPVKVSLKSRILETTILSMIPILPMLIKQFMIILQTRQQKPQQEQEPQSNMRYVATNLLDF